MVMMVTRGAEEESNIREGPPRNRRGVGPPGEGPENDPCNPPSDSPLVTTVMDLRNLEGGIKIKYNYKK